MTDIIIECGVSSLTDFQIDSKTHPLETIQRMKRIAKIGYSIDLEIIIYDGPQTPRAGGRDSEFSRIQLQDIIQELNGNGLPFMLSLNGGMNLPDNTDWYPDERTLLEQMAQTPDVGNKVTIADPRLLDKLKDEFPDLELIASCIQQVFPHTAGYADKFPKYDYVVILNQDTTLAILEPHMAYADQMIVFLNLACHNPDLSKCCKHYKTKDKSFPDKTPVSKDGCYGTNAALIGRYEELSEMVRKRITKFKVPRDSKLYQRQFYTLLTIAHDIKSGDNNSLRSVIPFYRALTS
jgi:hypothetical protein